MWFTCCFWLANSLRLYRKWSHGSDISSSCPLFVVVMTHWNKYVTEAKYVTKLLDCMWLLLLFWAKPHPGEITLASKCGPYTLWALADDVDVYILTSSMIMISWRKFSGQHLKRSEVNADFTEISQKRPAALLLFLGMILVWSWIPFTCLHF